MQPNNNPEGQATLNDFVGKKSRWSFVIVILRSSAECLAFIVDVDVQINGYDGSTNISSLSEAFKSLSLGAVLPGLTSDLLATTALEGAFTYEAGTSANLITL